jgi:uroporphyrinogen decarboxylase
MFSDEPTWRRLMDQLADITLASLRAQVERGASAVQLFDSWAGALHPDDYRRYVLPHSRRVLDGLADLDVPRIHFGVATGELLGAMAEAGADVVGVDWRVPLEQAWDRVPSDVALQGNLEPALALGPTEVLLERTRQVLRASGDRATVRVQPRARGPAADRSRPAPSGRRARARRGAGRGGPPGRWLSEPDGA